MQLKSADSYTTPSNNEDASLRNIVLGSSTVRRFNDSRLSQSDKDLIYYALEFEIQNVEQSPSKVILGYQEHQKLALLNGAMILQNSEQGFKAVSHQFSNAQKFLEQSNQPTEDGLSAATKALLSWFRFNKALLATQANLVDLFRGEDEEPLPTEQAFIAAWQLVSAAYSLLEDDVPKASAATDDEGGIRLRWRSADLAKDVRLYCPGRPDRKSYIYHQAGDKYEGVYDVTDSTLAKWLHWLNEDR